MWLVYSESKGSVLCAPYKLFGGGESREYFERSGSLHTAW